MSLNTSTLTGRAGCDPVIKEIGEHKVAELSFFWDTYAKGEKQSNVITVKAWNKVAETLEKFIKKGNAFGVSGKLSQDKWEKDGKEYSKHVLTAEQIELPPKSSQGAAPVAAASKPEDGMPF